MGDLRLNDWVNITLWLLGIGGSMITTVLLLIVWPHIVSIVSRIGAKARAEGEARRAYRQRVYDHEHMSSWETFPVSTPIDSSQRSPAVEQGWEQSGSGGAFPVPALWEQLEQLSDDELLDVLARVKDASGNPKYADSRIAKFIGGRVEDRTNQVRDVRGSEPPPPKPQAVLRVRDNGHERLIAKYGHEPAR